ncbi:hypothetical protein [Brevibacillus formosus]|uniref:hypothetical protein n=1 Tax=Brevibacillus formosus TaxID=54913 RepID=UPI003F1E1403
MRGAREVKGAKIDYEALLGSLLDIVHVTDAEGVAEALGISQPSASRKLRKWLCTI